MHLFYISPLLQIKKLWLVCFDKLEDCDSVDILSNSTQKVNHKIRGARKKVAFQNDEHCLFA